MPVTIDRSQHVTPQVDVTLTQVTDLATIPEHERIDIQSVIEGHDGMAFNTTPLPDPNHVVSLNGSQAPPAGTYFYLRLGVPTQNMATVYGN